jgi:hypothetical protein
MHTPNLAPATDFYEQYIEARPLTANVILQGKLCVDPGLDTLTADEIITWCLRWISSRCRQCWMTRRGYLAVHLS